MTGTNRRMATSMDEHAPVGTARSETPVRILVVEDEADIAALIAYQLTREGFRVETAGSGRDALEAVDREVPDLIVLDRMIPDLSGDEVLRWLRREDRTVGVPVLVLTAKREQEERIEGLELGADDYLTKPFSPRELVLRVHSLLRRVERIRGGRRRSVLRAGALAVDPNAHLATLEGEELNLTPTEFRLLRTLVERQGRTQSRRQLLEKAWEMDANVADRLQTRTVDMHVRRLRGKLGPCGDWVETVRGFGYRLRVPDLD